MVSAELREKVRPWIVEQLRVRTDLDPSDMSEYVVTLLEYNGTREELHNRCVKELGEFLNNNTEDFVGALLDQIEILQNESQQQAQPPQQQQQQQQFQQPQQLQQPQQQQQQFTPGAPGNPQFPGMPGMPPFPFDFSQLQNMPFPMPGMPGMPPMQNNNVDGRYQNQNQRGNRRHNNFQPRQQYSSISSVDNELSVANRRLVVEKVPEEKLNEESLREYFSQFGTLTRIKINRNSQLAELEFEGHDQALAAHRNPAPIFDNRFVKVYWRKGDDNDPQEIDIEAVKRMQEQRQKDFKEKEAKRKEYQQRIQELIEKRATLLQEQEALLKEQAAKGSAVDNSESISEKQKLTNLLREQLDTLKEEATQLGILGGTASAYRGGRGRGARGNFRSRASFRGGRGSFRGGRGGFGAATLDLRPKSVLVKGVTEQNQEALMHELVSSKYTNVDRKSPDSVVINFSDRWSAEQFFNGPKSLPELGTVEKSWTRNEDTQMTDS